MTNDFFSSEMRRMRLGIAARDWIGTRFVAHANKRGAGVDCVHLAAEIYRDCGVFEKYEFPNYTLDGGSHLDSSKVLEWLEASGHFARLKDCSGWKIDDKTVKPGDLLTFKMRKVEHHVGVMITAQLFVHVIEKRQVETALLSDPTFWLSLTHVYRPLEAEVRA
jgi:cell wall-associated NlpC family hydrolase